MYYDDIGSAVCVHLWGQLNSKELVIFYAILRALARLHVEALGIDLSSSSP